MFFRLSAVAALCLSLALAPVPARAVTSTDVVVYGATPAGIAAAILAARQGHAVVLAEPTPYVGGLLTGGLSYTDFRTQESVTGFFREYMDRVLAHYTKKYGAGSTQVRECFRGAHAEPHVSSQVLGEMLAEQKSLIVATSWKLQAVGRKERTVTSASFATPNGVRDIQARFFIDATYEGDLAAAARVRTRLGRESTRVYGERYAGVLYFDQGRILPGSTGEGDNSVQCSNYRVIMTDDPALRVAVPKPTTYRREEFTHLLPLFQSGRITNIYSEDHSGILRLQRLPNRKSDMNDIKQAPVRLALPGENQQWPEGDWGTRERIARRHLDYAMGLLYFLQNDAELPSAIREKAREWGLAKDEFADNGHLPTALYIREGRRVEGHYTFTEHDTLPAPLSVRTRVQRDAVAIGDYSLNNHGHFPQGPLHPQLVEGDFSASTTPFQIPYGVMVPRDVDNLLVPVAVSASHIGYSAIRLEPTWTALGHAAGLAAHLHLKQGKVEVPQLQAMLHRQGQATIYTSDVPPSHALFAAVQWAGLRGLLSDIHDYRSSAIPPLRKYPHGLQYSHAFGLHDVAPEKQLDGRLRGLWEHRLPCAKGIAASTRGEFLEKAWRQCAAGESKEFVLLDVTFDYSKQDADTSTPNKSHYYVKDPVLNIARPRNWLWPVDYRNGTVRIRLEVLSKSAGGAPTTWTLCYIPNRGQGNGYGCTGTDIYREAGVYEKEVKMTEFWQNQGIVWEEGIKQMDLVIKDDSGGAGHAHKRTDHERFFPTRVRLTMTQVPAR
jgi:hypothetical protein